MINSNNLVSSFIESIQLTCLYVEDNFPLPLESGFRMPPEEAVDYLTGAALVGNKAVGLFHKVPHVNTTMPVRAVCIFIATELPDEINMPMIFCKKPDDLAELLPKANKLSADTGMPVQIIISANALNNYSEKAILTEAQDRSAPYLSAASVSKPWDTNKRREKLLSAYAWLQQNIPQTKAGEKISMNVTDAWFPQFLVPVYSKEQAALYDGLKKIRTTEKESGFVAMLTALSRLDTELVADLQEEKNLTKSLLCPGCPFMALFSLKETAEHLVFSSVHCPAVTEIYPVINTTYATYLGIISQAASMPTVFVGALCDMGNIDPDSFANGKVIALMNNESRTPLPPLNPGNKLKQLKSGAYPYHCKNIKKSTPVKVKEKRCDCLKKGIAPVCIEKTHCFALYEGADSIQVKSKQCNGCRICAVYCPSKALS